MFSYLFVGSIKIAEMKKKINNILHATSNAVNGGVSKPYFGFEPLISSSNIWVYMRDMNTGRSMRIRGVYIYMENLYRHSSHTPSGILRHNDRVTYTLLPLRLFHYRQ